MQPSTALSGPCGLHSSLARKHLPTAAGAGSCGCQFCKEYRATAGGMRIRSDKEEVGNEHREDPVDDNS